MSGSYPDNPGRRLAWDDDGTVVLVAGQNNGDTGVGVPPGIPYTNASVAEMEDMNDEDHASKFGANSNNNNRVVWVTHLFAEKHEIDGAYHVHEGSGGGPSSSAATSVDTTNGYDGTWVDLSLTDFHNISPPLDHYRDNITSQALSNILGTMFKVEENDGAFHNSIHIYGAITPGETTDRLLFLDPDNADAEFTKPLDFGDVPRGQTQTDTFKLKNNSSGVTANTVQVTAEDLYLGSGSWYTFSDDDVSYSATLGLGNIGVGATQLVYVKQIVPDAQAPGVYVARVKANQASWS